MTKDRRLKNEAMEACRYRGHWMSAFKKLKPTLWRSKCLWCDMDVDVNTKPLPNEIEIGGEAVALTCTYSPKDDAQRKWDERR